MSVSPNVGSEFRYVHSCDLEFQVQVGFPWKYTFLRYYEVFLFCRIIQFISMKK